MIAAPPHGEIDVIDFLRFSKRNRYFARSIFNREAWRKGAHPVRKEGNVIQKKNQPDKSVIQTFRAASSQVIVFCGKYSATNSSPNGEIRNRLSTILENVIDIFGDRFLSGKHGGMKHL